MKAAQTPVVAGGVTWPKGYRVVPPEEEFSGETTQAERKTIFGHIGVIDDAVAKDLKIGGLPQNLDGSAFVVAEIRAFTSTSVHVVIRHATGRIAALMYWKAAKVVEDGLASQIDRATAAARSFVTLQDPEAIAWLQARGITGEIDRTVLADYRRQATDMITAR